MSDKIKEINRLIGEYIGCNEGSMGERLQLLADEAVKVLATVVITSEQQFGKVAADKLAMHFANKVNKARDEVREKIKNANG